MPDASTEVIETAACECCDTAICQCTHSASHEGGFVGERKGVSRRAVDTQVLRQRTFGLRRMTMLKVPYRSSPLLACMWLMSIWYCAVSMATVTVRLKPLGGCHSSLLTRPVKSFIKPPSANTSQQVRRVCCFSEVPVKQEGSRFYILKEGAREEAMCSRGTLYSCGACIHYGVAFKILKAGLFYRGCI